MIIKSATNMPRAAYILKRLVALLLLFLFLWLIFITFQSDDQTVSVSKKYKAKHDYSGIYKNKLSKVETPQQQEDKKAFMFRQDLQPKLVYRGTDEEIDPSDIGLVRNAEDKKLLDDGYKQYAFNSLVSSRLGFFRTINDTRHKDCLDKKYPSDLPSASVIICFYNEEFHTLMRSVFSVIRRSPDDLVKEIILLIMLGCLLF